MPTTYLEAIREGLWEEMERDPNVFLIGEDIGVYGGAFKVTPGLKVVAPSTAYDAKGLIKSSIRDNDPVIFFEHKGLYRRIKEDLPEGDWTVPIGKAKVVREGADLTIVAYGSMVWVALEAAD